MLSLISTPARYAASSPFHDCPQAPRFTLLLPFLPFDHSSVPSSQHWHSTAPTSDIAIHDSLQTDQTQGKEPNYPPLLTGQGGKAKPILAAKGKPDFAKSRMDVGVPMTLVEQCISGNLGGHGCLESVHMKCTNANQSKLAHEGVLWLLFGFTETI
jgi:hypothetical protein